MNDSGDEALSSNLYATRLSGFSTDVVLVCKEKEFPAHQLILSSRSEFFRKTFTSDFKEGFTKRVDFSHVDEHILNLVLDFIYEPLENNITEETVENLLQLVSFSHMLSIKHLTDLSLELILIKINVENCVNIANAVKLYGNQNSWQDVLNFLIVNFKDVAKSEDFMKIDREIFKVVLLNSRKQKNEIKDYLFEAIIKWMQADKARQKDVSELILCLDFNFISKEYLSELLANDDFQVFENKLLNDFLQLQIQSQIKSKELIQKTYVNVQNVSHPPSSPSVKLYLFGSYKRFSSRSTILCEEPRVKIVDIQNKVKPVYIKLPFKLGDGSLCTYCDFKFYFLGRNLAELNEDVLDENPSWKFLCYSPFTNKSEWKLAPVDKGNARITSLHNNIYVFSLDRRDLYLQVYNINKQQWSKCITVNFYLCEKYLVCTANDRITVCCSYGKSSMDAYDIKATSVFRSSIYRGWEYDCMNPTFSTFYNNKFYIFNETLLGYRCLIIGSEEPCESLNFKSNEDTKMEYCFSTEKGIFFYNSFKKIFYFDEIGKKLEEVTSFNLDTSPYDNELGTFSYDILSFRSY